MDKCEHNVIFYPVSVPVQFKTVKEYLNHNPSFLKSMKKNLFGPLDETRFHWYCSKCFVEFEPIFKEVEKNG